MLFRRVLPLTARRAPTLPRLKFSNDSKTQTQAYDKEKLEELRKKALEYEKLEHVSANYEGRLQNTIWTNEEIDELLHTLYRHQPTRISDKFVNKLMYGLYNTFNWVTGYKPVMTSVTSVEWRLILLESIAGLPGFIAAGTRHFRSLRKLTRDHGWISTLLEEAENERMHLFVCLKMFKAGWLTRQIVLAGQVIMAPVLILSYALHPRAVHRFVGYLEETACHTYANVIGQVETPGTPLHAAWRDLPAPATAIAYWRLPPDAKWVDCLKRMFADECHHRDVNHTFSDMQKDDPSPFVGQFRENAARAAAWKAGAKTSTSADPAGHAGPFTP